MNRFEVLLVNREKDIIQALAQIFARDFDIECIQCDCLESAKSFIGLQNFDLIVCDFETPSQSQAEIARMLVDQGKFPPLIFFNSRSMPAEVMAGFEYPVVFIDNKDFKALRDVASELFLDRSVDEALEW